LEKLKKDEFIAEKDLTVLHPRDQSFYRRQESNLKRTLIEAAKTDLPDTVDRIYSFRNEYISHLWAWKGCCAKLLS
jgi:hypothetical protein